MNELLKEFLLTFLTALATGLAAVIIKLITAKIAYITAKTQDEKKIRFLTWLEEDVIVKCINTTTQTYVDELKKQGNFNADAQKVAMEKTTEAILTVLTEADKELLETYVDDISTWITTRVESYMQSLKDVTTDSKNDTVKE